MRVVEIFVCQRQLDDTSAIACMTVPEESWEAAYNKVLASLQESKNDGMIRAYTVLPVLDQLTKVTPYYAKEVVKV